MTQAEHRMTAPPTEGTPRPSQLLARLATHPATLAQERRALPPGTQTRLRALLREIDETVLPRVMLLRAGPLDVARLTISQRHLISIDVPRRADAPAEPADMAMRCAARLIQVAETQGQILMTLRRRGQRPNQAEPALSVRALEQALGLAQAGTALDRLQARIAGLALAECSWGGTAQPLRLTGDQRWWPALQAVSGPAPRPARRDEARIGPQLAEGLAIPLSDSHLLIVARHDASGLAAIVPRLAGLAAIAAWQTS